MKLLTVKEVAEILKISVSAVRWNADRGTLGFRAVRAGSQWRFPEDEVMAYIYGNNWKEKETKNEDAGNTEACTD